MKPPFIILMFFLSICSLYSQTYDLVVKTNSDSIACHIDSITNSKIFIELRYNEEWSHSYINLNEIKEYKEDAVNISNIYFESGSSKFHSRKYTNGNHHSNMYLFGPTAFSLNKGDLYYTTYYGLIHDFQFGITDRFMLRTGTFLFLPFHFIANYTFPINDKSSFAVGDLFIFLIGEFYGSLTYGMYTHGTKENNISLGVGFWTPNIIEIGEVNNSAAINLSGQYKISDRVYLTSENYGFQLYSNHVAQNVNIDLEEDYHANDGIFFGLSGIKVKGRTNGLNSWQLSLLYVFIREGEAPEKYHSPEWEGVDEGKITFVPIPIIGYSIKFGKNYKK